MKQNGTDTKMYVLHSLVGIPQKILSSHERDNLTELVLHELCNKHCLDLERAAYFVDNPDFNFFKGVGGVDRLEIVGADTNIWDNPERFNTYMRKSNFNNKVRSFLKESCSRNGEAETETTEKIAQELKLQHPHFHSWNMKHGNRGFFVYEQNDDTDQEVMELIPHAVCLLGFCPVG